MIPVGYMAKRSCKKPEAFGLPNVVDIYSVGSCVNDDFADYINYWKHNGYWLFDSPEVIRAVAQENSIELQGTMLFYYEAHEMEFTKEGWRSFSPEPSFPTHIVLPSCKSLEGFDVVTFSAGNSPECSPLSCNGLAEDLCANSHCLFDSFSEAEAGLISGRFTGGEPGPYRIFAVYSVDWP
ncbi:MAG: hypothetical protein P4L26_17545 [Terracidiphilus sp.]|nr:hypothetical protein [Terracidiphilus sp.]